MSADGRRDAELLVPSRVRIPRAYEDLAEGIRYRIINGELKPGDRLPSETALAEEARLSRSTVREAMRILQESGYIERLSRKVMVVRGQTDERAHEELRQALFRRNVTFGRLQEALLILEPELTSLAATRGCDDDIRELQRQLAVQEQHTHDFETWNRLDQEFHLKIAEMSSNPALIIARTPITQLLMPVLRRGTAHESHTLEALAYHRELVETIRERDPQAAGLVAKRHVNAFRRRWERAGFDLDATVEEPPAAADGGGDRA